MGTFLSQGLAKRVLTSLPTSWLTMYRPRPHRRDRQQELNRVVFAATVTGVLTLRLTNAADLPSVLGWEAEPETSAWLGEIGSAWHTAALTDPDQEHLVALGSQGSSMGFAVLAGLCKQGHVELRRIVIPSALRSSGCGRALLKAILARAYRMHRARQVWLDVKAHNHRARNLYESEGFEATEILADAVTEADGSCSDLVIMAHWPGIPMR